METNLPQEIYRLRMDIHMFLQQRLSDFRARTGVTPDRIELEMVDATTHGDTVKQFLLANVRISLGEL